MGPKAMEFRNWSPFNKLRLQENCPQGGGACASNLLLPDLPSENPSLIEPTVVESRWMAFSLNCWSTLSKSPAEMRK